MIDKVEHSGGQRGPGSAAIHPYQSIPNAGPRPDFPAGRPREKRSDGSAMTSSLLKCSANLGSPTAGYESITPGKSSAENELWHEYKDYFRHRKADSRPKEKIREALAPRISVICGCTKKPLLLVFRCNEIGVVDDGADGGSGITLPAPNTKIGGIGI